MRTNPHTYCPIRTCTVITLRDAVAAGDVEMADATLREFPEGRWVTVTPMFALPNDEMLVVEVTGEADIEPIAAMVTATMAWFMTQPMLLAVHHNLGQLLADSVDLHHPALASIDVNDSADIDPDDDPVEEVVPWD
jgi:hypothetical protein